MVLYSDLALLISEDSLSLMGKSLLSAVPDAVLGSGHSCMVPVVLECTI